MAKSNFYSNRSICVSTVFLLFLDVIVLGLGGLIYWVGYRSIQDKEISGAPYLPEFEITYKNVKLELLISCCLSGVVLIFGLLLAKLKSPLWSTIYVIMALLCGLFMLYTATLLLDFESQIKDQDDDFCLELKA